MPFPFDTMKTIQAAAVLLRRAEPHHAENYMKLIKLLYLADRRSLQETGRPITGDQYVVMKRGPVVSRVLDLIKDRSFESPEWSRFIVRDRNNVELRADPGNGKLCRYEIDVLHQVWEQHKDTDPFDLVEELHRLPEIKKNRPEGNGANDLPLIDILEAVGREDDLAAIEADAREMNAARHLLGA
jgi:uncharacterized phage-associated protein